MLNPIAAIPISNGGISEIILESLDHSAVPVIAESLTTVGVAPISPRNTS
jgi:hypothetical protein